MDIFEFERSYDATSWVRNEVYTGDMLYIVYLLRSTYYRLAICSDSADPLYDRLFVQCSEKNIRWLKAVFMGNTKAHIMKSHSHTSLAVSVVPIWLAPIASLSLEPVAKMDNVTEL